MIEMLVAALLLSGAVVVLCAVGTKSMIGVRLNRQHETAWGLLDRQFTMIDYIGVEEFIEMRQMSGEFDMEAMGDVVYQWEAAVEQGQADNVYLVSIGVSWANAGRGGRISASTVLSGQEETESSDETTEQEQDNESVS